MIKKRGFSAAERAAIYKVHGGKCYACGKPVDLVAMQVDHLIPEKLLDTPDELKHYLLLHGLPPDFNVNGFENWMPACAPCNNLKRDGQLNKSVLMQIVFENAARRAPKAEAFAEQTISEAKISKSINDLRRAAERNPEIKERAERLTAELADMFRPEDAQLVEEIAHNALSITDNTNIQLQLDGGEAITVDVTQTPPRISVSTVKHLTIPLGPYVISMDARMECVLGRGGEKWEFRLFADNQRISTKDDFGAELLKFLNPTTHTDAS